MHRQHHRRERPPSTGLSGHMAGAAAVAGGDGDIAGVASSSTMRNGVKGGVVQTGYIAGKVMAKADTAIRLEVEGVPDSRDFTEDASGAHGTAAAAAAATAAASPKVESATKDVSVEECVGIGDQGLGMGAVGEEGDAVGGNS